MVFWFVHACGTSWTNQVGYIILTAWYIDMEFMVNNHAFTLRLRLHSWVVIDHKSLATVL